MLVSHNEALYWSAVLSLIQLFLEVCRIATLTKCPEKPTGAGVQHTRVYYVLILY